MKNAEKEARKLRKMLHGQINFETLSEYIEQQGYSVILYSDNNKLLKRYKISEIAKTKSAFTYTDKHTKIVFIRESLHSNDKLIYLLHEIGHITLGHMEGNYLRVSDRIETEYQADNFAHLVICPRTLPSFVKPLGMCILILLLISSTAINGYLITKQYTEKAQYISAASVVTYEETEYVFITGSGKKYHREKCSYAKKGMRIDIEEASKAYTPCTICNP